MVQKLKTRIPTAMQIAEGIEYLSPLKSLPGWTMFVQFDLVPNPQDDEEWIEDFIWAVKKPANGKQRRRINIGSQQLGFDKLSRLPMQAQHEFQNYAHKVWQSKIDSVLKYMDKVWDKEERDSRPEGYICTD